MWKKSARFIALTLAAAVSAPAMAQVRVVIDGQVQEVPDGIVRTISYAPGGRQTIHDERYQGPAAQGCVTVTTTETTEENEDGSPIRTVVETRIEPIAAAAYSAPIQQLVYTPAPQTVERTPPPLEIEPDAIEMPEQIAGEPQTLRIRRDAVTGHFITTVRINGVKVRAIVDTGAQSTILSARDARATGANNEVVQSRPMAGIGGYTLLNVARIRSLEVSGQQLGGFSAAIGQEGIPYTLLGQTEIARLGRIVIEDGVMTITPRGARIASR